MQPQDANNGLLQKALRHRWIIWGMLIIPYILSFFHRMGVSAVRDELAAAYGLSGAAFGMIGAMYFYAYSVAQIPAGLLVDTIGSRITVSVGMLIAAAGSFLFGGAGDVTSLYVGRLLIGLGVSVCYISLMKIHSQWFREKEFATLAGACLFLGNLGSLFAQAPMSFLVSRVSLSGSFYILGALAAFSGIGCFLIVRNRPQDCGYPPINEAQQSAAAAKATVGEAIKAIATNPYNIAPIICYFCVAATFYAFAGTWGISYFKEMYAISTAEASTYLLALIAGFMVGCFVCGAVSDRIGARKNVLVLTTALLVALWGLLTFWNPANPPRAVLFPLLFLIGGAMGNITIVMAIVKEVNQRQYTGTAIAVLNSFSALGGAVITWLFGVVLDGSKHLPLNEQYYKALLLLLGVNCVALVTSLLCKETGGTNIYERLRK